MAKDRDTKRWIAEEVMSAIIERFEKMEPMTALEPFLLTEISPSELSIRWKPENGSPRYFRVKVSESW